jgi:hypothetical protein
LIIGTPAIYSSRYLRFVLRVPPLPTFGTEMLYPSTGAFVISGHECDIAT